MIEFALSFPFLLFMLVSILYFGRYFLIAQVLLAAAQEGAKIAARTPNLSDDNVRDMLRGFTKYGVETNPNSVIYGALASANLLSGTISGNMPPGSQVEILPWDQTVGDILPPPGTIAVKIAYPFQFLGSNLGNPFSGNVAIAFTVDGSKPAFVFPNFTISQQVTAAQEIYQQ
jgi:hypothetical protein